MTSPRSAIHPLGWILFAFYRSEVMTWYLVQSNMDKYPSASVHLSCGNIEYLSSAHDPGGIKCVSHQ